MRLGGCQVHQGTLNSLGCVLAVVRFFQVHWCALLCSSCSSGVAGFIGVRPGGRRVDPGSLRSLQDAQGVVGVIQGCFIYLGTRWGSSDLSKFAGFIG